MTTLSDAEWRALLCAVRDAVSDIVTGSGYGSVTIECVAGSPKGVKVQRSLRFNRDIYPDEDKLPQGAA
jgi:hypothetical protein